MTKAETAHYLELNRELILQLIAQGILSGVGDQDRIKIKRSDVDQLMAQGILPGAALPI
jgi:excisionase family DNA binding protein